MKETSDLVAESWIKWNGVLIYLWMFGINLTEKVTKEANKKKRRSIHKYKEKSKKVELSMSCSQNLYRSV